MCIFVSITGLFDPMELIGSCCWGTLCHYNVNLYIFSSQFLPDFFEIVTKCWLCASPEHHKNSVNYFQWRIPCMKLCNNVYILQTKSCRFKGKKIPFRSSETHNCQLNHGPHPSDSGSKVPFPTDSWQKQPLWLGIYIVLLKTSASLWPLISS